MHAALNAWNVLGPISLNVCQLRERALRMSWIRTLERVVVSAPAPDGPNCSRQCQWATHSSVHRVAQGPMLRPIEFTAAAVARATCLWIADVLIKTIVTALVISRVNYCLSVYGNGTKKNLSRLQKIPNFATRVIFGRRKFDHVSYLREKLDWMPPEHM